MNSTGLSGSGSEDAPPASPRPNTHVMTRGRGLAVGPDPGHREKEVAGCKERKELFPLTTSQRVWRDYASPRSFRRAMTTHGGGHAELLHDLPSPIKLPTFAGRDSSRRPWRHKPHSRFAQPDSAQQRGHGSQRAQEVPFRAHLPAGTERARTWVWDAKALEDSQSYAQ